MFSFEKIMGAALCVLSLSACAQHTPRLPEPPRTVSLPPDSVYPSMSTVANYVSGDQVQMYSLDDPARPSFSPGYRDDMSERSYGVPSQVDEAVMVYPFRDEMDAAPFSPSAPVMMPPSEVRQEYLSPFPAPSPGPALTPEPSGAPQPEPVPEQVKVGLPDWVKPLPRGYND